MPSFTTDIKTVQIRMGDIDIQFLNPEGDPLVKGDKAQKHMWVCNIPGVDPARIKSVKIPKLVYDEVGVLAVEVEMYTNEFWNSIKVKP